MDISRILLDILIVLVAAKVAAEVAERIGIPAVVGEILAGILVGPSLLGLVGRGDEVLRALGEIGVILLLLDVGLEMDVGELRKVGGASLRVAVIGVVAPMALGYALMRGMGESTNTALFVASALTATSVGITARVFGDLRALATSEARVVLGAAVADDVMGLVVLTVVVRLVTEGSVSVAAVLGIVLVAVAFLVVGAGLGLRLAPALFRAVSRIARSNGTLLALAFSFTLGFAELANTAKLAPIVGAFLAGLSLGRADQADRIRSELAPVGHLFIPVFFLQIGIDAELDAFGRTSVLRDAALLLVVAVVGKLVAAIGAGTSAGDRLLIGLGMLPRGEVGLIFATIGLQAGVLGPDLYAALLLVVLATTLVTPPLLKQRARATRAARSARAADASPPVDPVPVVLDGAIHLPGPVTPGDALTLALRAALLARHAQPADDLTTWLASLPDEALGWNEFERDLLIDVVERGGSRSWRFLEISGVLDRALPELADALRSRRDDPFDLDPGGAYRWRTLERLRVLDAGGSGVQEARRLAHPIRLLLAALLTEALETEPDPVATARRILDRIGLDRSEADDVVALVADQGLLWAAARRTGAFSEEQVQSLAGHLQTAERVRGTYVLAALRDEGREPWERTRLEHLHGLIQATLAATSPDDARGHLLQARRAELADLLVDDEVAAGRAARAPSAYLLTSTAREAAAQFRLVDPVPARGRVRVTFSPNAGHPPAEGRWSLSVATRDRLGMFAAIAGALVADGYDVERADLVTWADRAALGTFVVAGADRPDLDRLEGHIEQAWRDPAGAVADRSVELVFDDRASPWHTVCEVDAPERPGLLADLVTAFRAAGVAVRAATIVSHDGRAYDTFELTTPDGAKLEAADEHRIRRLVSGGVGVRHRRLRRPSLVPTGG